LGNHLFTFKKLGTGLTKDLHVSYMKYPVSPKGNMAEKMVHIWNVLSRGLWLETADSVLQERGVECSKD
jgi:hypothetical protein